MAERIELPFNLVTLIEHTPGTIRKCQFVAGRSGGRDRVIRRAIFPDSRV